jgi:hypothetical protein
MRNPNDLPSRRRQMDSADFWYNVIGCLSVLMSLAVIAAIITGIILAWRAWG